MAGETPYLYLAISTEAVSAVLVREIGTNQNLVYFCSKALVGLETRSKKSRRWHSLATRKLMRYFLAHSIIVPTDQSLKNVFFSPDLAGRMTKWSIKHSEFDITFEAR